MKIAIWGTGGLYYLYKNSLKQEYIELLIDSNSEKQGTILDDKKIYSPKDVDYSNLDYVLLLVTAYEEIKSQLLGYAIPEAKIITYKDIPPILQNKPCIVRTEGKFFFDEWFEQSNRKKILLLSHDVSRTGVPIALMNLAILLKKMNYDVLYVSLGSGNLKEALEMAEIDYIDNFQIWLNNSTVAKEIERIDLCVMGTSAVAEAIPFFARTNRPMIWWLHESEKKWLDKVEISKKYRNITLYAVGKRVQRVLEKEYGIQVAGILPYYLPQKQVKQYRYREGNITFAQIGSLSKLKAQDLLLAAEKVLLTKYSGDFKTVFVGAIFGTENEEYYNKLRAEYPNFLWLGEKKSIEIDEFYQEIDVLVCPSREDTMPIVVTEAMQYGIPCIVSSHVGQEELIVHGENGFIFESENVEDLVEVMEGILKKPENLETIGKRGQQIYESNFSEENIKMLLENIIGGMLI